MMKINRSIPLLCYVLAATSTSTTIVQLVAAQPPKAKEAHVNRELHSGGNPYVHEDDYEDERENRPGTSSKTERAVVVCTCVCVCVIRHAVGFFGGTN